MTAPLRRCRCRGCLANSLRKSLWQIHAGRVLIAADIVILVMAELMVGRALDPLYPRGRAMVEHWYRAAGLKP